MARSKSARNLSREEEIKIVRKGGVRYLFNASDVDIERLRYQTGAMGEGYVSSVPAYEVRGLPSGTATQIEEVDPYEGGFILWQITEIDWADGETFEGLQNVTESRGWGGKEHEFVEREKEQIGEPTPPRTFEDETDEPSARELIEEELRSPEPVRELNLEGKRLTELPEEIASLESLDRLNLFANRLTELPGWVRRLTELKTLNLEGNQFEAWPDVVRSLPNLETLNLSLNRLEALPEDLSGLEHLTSLSLRGNAIKRIPASIGGLTRLRRLDLRGNDLSVLPPDIGKLKALSRLDVARNELQELPESIGALKELRFLDVERNRLERLPSSIGELKKLGILNLARNQLKDLPESIGTLPLYRIYLRGNAVPKATTQRLRKELAHPSRVRT